jgi:glyoxylase-like metal-dependent hydrolase (beta-lactamase superfamily II)
VTDEPITAVVYPHHHADHLGDIGWFVAAAEDDGRQLRIIGSEKTHRSMELSNSSFRRPTDVLDWPGGRFEFEATPSSCTAPASATPSTPPVFPPSSARPLTGFASGGRRRSSVRPDRTPCSPAGRSPVGHA